MPFWVSSRSLPDQARATRGIFALALGSTASLVGCSGGYDQGPIPSDHPYPPPANFSTQTGPDLDSTGSSAPAPEAAPACDEERQPWPQWDHPLGEGLISPRAAFSLLDHEIRTPLHWAPGPADDGRLSWNVADSRTHLTMGLHIDPHDATRTPVFVSQSPSRPDMQAGDCPSYWELPVWIDLSTGDLALRESKVPARLRVSAGGVSSLRAQIPSASILGQLTWEPGPSSAPPGADTTTAYRTPPVAALQVDAWLAKGVLWAQVDGVLDAGSRFVLGDGHGDDPRCQDQRRLRIGIDHPLGQLSAKRVMDAMAAFRDFELQWDGQAAQPLRLEALSPPTEICVDADPQQAPRAILDLSLRMTFVDPDRNRALIVTPTVRAASALGPRQTPELDVRYNAFSRTQESLGDFLVRHGLSDMDIPDPSPGLFEISMRLRNVDPKLLDGSVALLRYEVSPECATQPASENCASLAGKVLRTGTLRAVAP